jgi:hypothetical protein
MKFKNQKWIYNEYPSGKKFKTYMDGKKIKLGATLEYARFLEKTIIKLMRENSVKRKGASGKLR